MDSLVTAAPQYLLWNYTYYCNLNCAHCYSRAASYPEELDEEAYGRICDDLIEMQVFVVALGGGEVLFRKDALETTRRLSSGGLKVLITTNGWPVTDKVARKLKASGLAELYVSVDSSRASFHDVFRRKEGTWARAVAALRAAADADLRTCLSCVITKANVEELEAVVTLAEECGAAEVNFKRFRPAGNGLQSRAEYELADELGAVLDARLEELNRHSKVEVTLNFGAEAGELDNGCSCGIRSLALRPNGDVALCSYTEAVLGNVRETSISEIWRDSPILHAKRRGVSCAALHAQFSPSNPSLAPVRKPDALFAAG